MKRKVKQILRFQRRSSFYVIMNDRMWIFHKLLMHIVYQPNLFNIGVCAIGLLRSLIKRAWKKSSSSRRRRSNNTNKYSLHCHYCFIFSTIAIAVHVKQHGFLTLLNGTPFKEIHPRWNGLCIFFFFFFVLFKYSCKIEWLASAFFYCTHSKHTHAQTLIFIAPFCPNLIDSHMPFCKLVAAIYINALHCLYWQVPMKRKKKKQQTMKMKRTMLREMS